MALPKFRFPAAVVFAADAVPIVDGAGTDLRFVAPDAGTAWPVTRDSRPLLADEVRVWRVRLDLEARSVDRLARLLSDDEQDRAHRFHFRRDATRFVVCRAALRTSLADCLGLEPRRIGLRYRSHGKPELAPPFDRSGLRFNASHTEGVGLVAVTRDRRVGVDVERIRALPDLDELAERVFSPAERQALRRLPRAERLEGFFNCWTRKEAYLKAIGTGFADSLTGFTVSLAPGAPARLEHGADDAAAPNGWRLDAMGPAAGCVGAVAVDDRSARLACYTWREPAA
jgi:4'-phosphopantetheinyl transferase